MKALSLRQPWATLIITGRKTIEIRSWRPKKLKLPQSIFIHASKTVDKGILKAFGMPSDLPKGALLGEALMVEIIQYHSKAKWLEEMDKHLNRAEWFAKVLMGLFLETIVNIIRQFPVEAG
jgi:hypothetical protein